MLPQRNGWLQNRMMCNHSFTLIPHWNHGLKNGLTNEQGEFPYPQLCIKRKHNINKILNWFDLEFKIISGSPCRYWVFQLLNKQIPRSIVLYYIFGSYYSSSSKYHCNTVSAENTTTSQLKLHQDLVYCIYLRTLDGNIITATLEKWNGP